VSRCREKNSQCKMIDVEVWERSPQPPKARRYGDFGDFYKFLIKITHF